MIKFFIFDFGDVFINLNKNSDITELNKLGINSMSDYMISKNNQYEKGEISTEEVISYYQGIIPAISKKKIRNIWNSILLDFPNYRLEIIENFSKSNRCFLLSNINEMHLEHIKLTMGEYNYKRFTKCFEKVYYSHEIKKRKPDKDIFELVIKENNLIPNECFFIDDTLQNIVTAKSLGINCWNINPEKEDIIDIYNFL